ncbi:MAG: DNA repair protein RecO [Rhodospirillales bacterium]|nr:DNA repair protein RecO [Rhodospirillales bacterium]
MEWKDDAIILSSRRHGESSSITTVLSPEHGRYAGLVRGGSGKNKRGILQAGNHVRVQWRARLPEHLGTFTCELVHPHAAMVLSDPLRLMALSSSCAVADSVLPEREPHPPVYEGLQVLLNSLGQGDFWPLIYVKWELGLLGELGFGLDFSECAATGRNDDLVYVSPKSGKAVSAGAGEPYKDRLLPLPGFLHGSAEEGTLEDAADGARLTGYFLNNHVYEQHGGTQPEARARFVQALRKTADGSPRNA